MRLLTFACVLGIVFSICVSALAGDKEKAKKLFEEGVTFFEKGQFERASYYLDKAYEEDKNWQFLEYIAKTWLALERYDNAKAALEAYLREGGGRVPAKEKAWAKAEIEKMAKLKEHQANREKALTRFNKGRALFDKREYEKAIIEFEEAYQLNPNWEFLEYIGRTEGALKNYDRAISAYEKYLKEAGDRISGAQRTKIRKEIDVLSEMVKMEASREESLSHFEQGKSLLAKGQYEKAVKSLELAHRLYPTWEYLKHLAEALAGAKSYRRALETYQTYLAQGASKVPPEVRSAVENEIARLAKVAGEEQNAEQSKSLEKRGQQALASRQYTKALAQFQQAYELDPRYGLFVSIAQANEKLERWREAIDAYKRYLEEGGDGIAEEDRIRTEKRMAVLEEALAVEARKSRALFHFKLGMGYYARELYEKAVLEFNAARDLDPTHEILPHIAEAEIQLGNLNLAIEAYRRFLVEGGDRIQRDKRIEVETRLEQLLAVERGEMELGAVKRGALPDDYSPVKAEGETEGKASADGGIPEGEREPYDWDPRKRLWTWVAGGVGVGSFIGAIVLHSVANSEQKKIDDLCPGGQCPPEYLVGAQDRQEKVDNLRISTKALAVVGAVGVAAGITLFFVEPLFAPRAQPQVSLAPLFDGENAGLMLQGRF